MVLLAKILIGKTVEIEIFLNSEQTISMENISLKVCIKNILINFFFILGMYLLTYLRDVNANNNKTVYNKTTYDMLLHFTLPN